jgi:hypothetical protein
MPPVSEPSRRGLKEALIGGLVITVIAAVLGLAFILWFVRVQAGPRPADMLPADTQVYAALTTTLSNLPETPRITQGLREIFGLTLRSDAPAAVAALFGVTLSTDVESWVGSDIGIAVRGFAPQSGAPLDELLADGQVALFLASRNDPQAELFLARALEVRRNRGETVTSTSINDVTVYSGRAGSLFTHVALVDHYVVFSNSADLINGLITRAAAPEPRLSSSEAYRQHLADTAEVRSATYFSDGSPAAEAARAALRDLLQQTVAE